ncbi:hypothetical protein HMPREF0059_00931, partial [Actinomyces viscosus C505]
GNAAVGRLLVRHLLVRDGLEPTGTAVTDLYPGWVPAAYAEAAGAYALGTMDGVVAWVVWQAEAVLAGVQEAQRLCRAVQAGTWRAGVSRAAQVSQAHPCLSPAGGLKGRGRRAGGVGP